LLAWCTACLLVLVLVLLLVLLLLLLLLLIALSSVMPLLQLATTCVAVDQHSTSK